MLQISRLLAHCLFFIILFLSHFTHNDLNAHTFHSPFIIHNSLYFLHLGSSLIHFHTYSILRSRLLNYIREPSLWLWLHNVQIHSPIAFTHISSFLSTLLLIILLNSYSHSHSLNYDHDPVFIQLHSHWTGLHSQIIVSLYTLTLWSHDIVRLTFGHSTNSIHNNNAISHKTITCNHCGVYLRK